MDPSRVLLKGIKSICEKSPAEIELPHLIFDNTIAHGGRLVVLKPPSEQQRMVNSHEEV